MPTLPVLLILAVAVVFLGRRAFASAQRLRAAGRATSAGVGCDSGCGCGDSAKPQRWDELPR